MMGDNVCDNTGHRGGWGHWPHLGHIIAYTGDIGHEGWGNIPYCSAVCFFLLHVVIILSLGVGML